jgi:steroid delta-isomerase-like uncharacterized protein
MQVADQNAALARRWFEEVWNQRRAETIDELMTPECLGHLESGDVHGPEEFRRVHAEFMKAFPDFRITIEAALAEGDDVVVRWWAEGCHLDDGLGVKATRETVYFRGMTWLRFRDGKLVEGWDCWNHGALHHKLQEADRRREAGGG